MWGLIRKKDLLNTTIKQILKEIHLRSKKKNHLWPLPKLWVEPFINKIQKATLASDTSNASSVKIKYSLLIVRRNFFFHVHWQVCNQAIRTNKMF